MNKFKLLRNGAVLIGTGSILYYITLLAIKMIEQLPEMITI